METSDAARTVCGAGWLWTLAAVIALGFSCAKDGDDGPKGQQGPPGPAMPVIQSITATGLPAQPGGTVTIEVKAQSPEGLTLTYDWTMNPTTWVVTSGAGTTTVTVTAPSTYGATGSATVTVTDTESRVATALVSLSTEGNTAPVIHTIAVYPNPVAVGGTITAEVVASDPNGDTMTYTWAVPVGFTLDAGQGSEQITATATQLASGLVTVTVDDGNGGTVMGQVYVSTVGNTPPVIHTLSAYPNPVKRGMPLTAEVAAADADGDPLSFTWAVPAGFTLDSGQGTAQVTATPTCFTSGLVEVTVDDGNGGSVTARIYVSTLDGAWGTAQLIETNNAGRAEHPQVAMDASGNAIAVWSQRDGASHIWANRFARGVGWGTAEQVANGPAGEPHVAMDPTGNAMVVWVQWDGTRSNLSAGRFVPGGGWDPATVIDAPPGESQTPYVATDPNGNAIAVWSQNDGTEDNIWANRFVPGAGWGAPELIETGPGGAREPRVAMDPSGSAVAVWYQDDGPVDSIWANRFVPGGGWGTAERIEIDNTGGAWQPRVEMDASGNAIAAWYQNDGTRESIWANRFVPGAGWGVPELVEMDDTYSAWDVDVAVDPDGNAIAVWFQGARGDFWANRFLPGAGWGTPTLLETHPGDGWISPDVAMDPRGNAIAVWLQEDGTLDDVWANRFVPGAGWGARTLLETDAGDAGTGYGFPRVAVDPSGNAIVVWVQSDGTRENVWANRFE